jgi:PST family polysaccharide transporter
LSSPSPSNAEIPASEPQVSSSYGQILKSSSIIGGAKAVNYLCSMVRIKAVAMLLGPAGVGMVGLYYAATNLVGTVSNLGIATSGGRAVACAHANGDTSSFARTVMVLRRISWATGLLGWLLTAFLAWPLSLWIFGSSEHAGKIALIGIILFFKAISDGQSSVVAGMRRTVDLAKIDVYSMVLGTIVAIGLYAWLREKGIVPVIVVTGAVALLCSWWVSRRIIVTQSDIDWKQTLAEAKPFLGLGLAVVGSTVASASAALAVRAEVVKQLGVDANGIFQAAQSLSVLFAGFILSAMAADFLPRLSAAADDPIRLNKLVNEQTEIGVLLSLPGIVATLMFAPWVLTILYSAEFVTGAPVLGWLLVASFGRVISWPMGYTLMARGESRIFLITEIAANAFYLFVSLILLRWLGMIGAAMAFPVLYLAYNAAMLLILHWRTGFRWSPSVWKLLILSTLMILSCFVLSSYLSSPAKLATGFLFTVVAGLLSIRGIATRLGPSHRLVELICRLPFGRLVCRI